MKKRILLSAVSLLSLVLFWNLAPPRYSFQRALVKLSVSNATVARPLVAILEDRINIQHFGGIPNDGVDDTPYLKTYRTLSASFGIKKVVRISEGTCEFDSLQIPAGLQIIGEGKEATQIYFRNASARAVFTLKGHAASIRDLSVEVIVTGTTNVAVVEALGSCFRNEISGCRFTLRDANAGTSRGVFLNGIGANEVLWTKVSDTDIFGFTYGIEAGTSGSGSSGGSQFINCNLADNIEDIRLGAGGGTSQIIGCSLGGNRGQYCIHLLSGCTAVTVIAMGEKISTDHIAGIRLDAGSEYNSVKFINAGDAPSHLDDGNNNDVQVMGTSQSVAGVAGPGNYHKMPYLDLTGESTANFFNGGLYLTNPHDSTATTGKEGRSLVFQSKASAGGSIQPTSAITPYRRFGPGNYGGIRFKVVDGVAKVVADMDYYGVKIRNGDVAVRDSTKGVILKAPNGTCYRLTISNTPALVYTACACRGIP